MSARLAVFAGFCTYFLLFRSYGFQVEDEGNLLFQLDRVLRGQLPYRDFETGYTPGFFYIGASVLRIGGESTTGMRMVLALLNAASATVLYVLARRMVGPALALVAPLAWVAFMPVWPGEFASFNVPYPAWFATLAWLLTVVCLDGWRRAVPGGSPRRLGWLGLAGATAALAFAIKPNAGAYAMAASVFVVAMTVRVAVTMDRVLVSLAGLAMAAGVWLAFGMAWHGVDVAVHLLPLAALAFVACGSLAGRFANDDSPRPLAALSVLAAGFVVPTAVWVVPFATLLGPERFASDVLLIGSGAAELYYTSHPAPEPYAVATVMGALALAAGGYACSRRWLRPAPLLGLFCAGALAVVAFIAVAGTMAESAGRSIVLQIENAGFWLAVLANWGGLWWLLRAGRREASACATPLVVLAPSAIAMYWQLYPRTDFMHLVIAVPLTAVVATALLGRVLDWWSRGDWPAWVDGRRVTAAATGLTVAGATAVAVLPALASASACIGSTAPQVDVARVRVCVERAAGDEFSAFAAATSYLEARVESGEAVLAFPALAGVLYAAELSAPGPYDYWYPGRPDRDQARAVLDRLERTPPRFVVTLNDGWRFFHRAPEYFAGLREFVTENYELAARFGRYDVLAHDDVDEVEPSSGRPAVAKLPPPGSATAVPPVEPVLALRRQAARRWMAALQPADVKVVELATGRREAVLELRALRDGGDLRGAAWLVAGHASADQRVRAEARVAMEAIVRRFEAARYRWADDLPLSDYRAFLEPVRAQAEGLAGDDDPTARKFGETVLSVIDP